MVGWDLFNFKKAFFSEYCTHYIRINLPLSEMYI